MEKVKIIFTQDVVVSLVSEKTPKAIKKDTIMYIDELENPTLWGFANITDKDVNYKSKKEESKKEESKKEEPKKTVVKK